MATSVPQTQKELKEHLADHIRFLESSAESFDDGFTGEAKRIATSLRVLFHDTGNSHSLLGQLGRKNIKFFDTALPIDADNLMAYSGLVGVWQGESSSRYVAFLDGSPLGQIREIEFDEWWKAPVFIDDSKNELSGRDLVLYVANQDGGAHVDPKLNEVYAKLSRRNSLSWYSTRKGKSKSLLRPERAAIRQIAHEVLKTLKPGYAKKMVTPGEGMIIADPRLIPTPPPELIIPKVGRNKRCPCGSGKKYKFCHG